MSTNGCKQTLSQLDQDSYVGVMQSLCAVAAGQPTCYTASYQAVIDFAGISTAAAAGSASVGCESLALQYSNTTSSIINQLCTMQSSVSSQEVSALNQQSVSIKINATGTVYLDGVNSEQSMVWNLDSNVSIDTNMITEAVTELSTSVMNDLELAYTSKTEGVVGGEADTFINASSTALEQINSNSMIIESTSQILQSLKAIQEFGFTIEAIGDVYVSDLNITQEMVVTQVIASAIRNIMTNINTTIMENDVLNQISTDIVTEQIGFQAENLKNNWLEYAVIGGCIVAGIAAIIGGVVAYNKFKNDADEERE
jgi:hypothetical protein